MQVGDLFYKFGFEPDLSGIKTAEKSIAQIKEKAASIGNVLSVGFAAVANSIADVPKINATTEFQQEFNRLQTNINSVAAKTLTPLSQTFSNVSKEMNTVFSTNEFKNSIKSTKNILEKNDINNLITKITNSKNVSEFISKNILGTDYKEFGKINNTSKLDNLLKS
jgi:hypothetical protein